MLSSRIRGRGTYPLHCFRSERIIESYELSIKNSKRQPPDFSQFSILNSQSPRTLKTLRVLILVLAIFAFPSCQSGKKSALSVHLDPELQQLAEEILASMDGPVTLRITRGGKGERMGADTQALVEHIAGITPDLSVKRVEISSSAAAANLGVTHGPVIEMVGQAPGTLRYYGYPERKETRPFLEGVLTASGHRADLAPEVISFLSALDEEVWIRIFTTPD